MDEPMAHIIANVVTIESGKRLSGAGVKRIWMAATLSVDLSCLGK
jgi:hypothetical protein